MYDLRRMGAVRTVVMTVLFAFTVGGCSEEPTQENSLTSALPAADIVIRDTTVVATGSSSFRQYLPMNGTVNMLGRFGNYVAYTVIEYFPSYLPIRDTIIVLSAKLKLRAVSWLGDPASRLEITMARVKRSWLSTSLTWDSVQTGFFDPPSNPIISSVTGGPDTQTVAVDLDTAVVRQWFLSASSTADTKYGIILVPTATTTNVMRGFAAFESDSASFVPTLEVIAGRPDGTPIDTNSYTAGMDTFVGNIDNLASSPSLLYLQSGVPYRSKLLFDVSFLPKGSIVNSAELLLERDPTTSVLTRFSSDSSIVVHVLLSATDNLSFEASGVPGTRKEGTGLTYSADARHAVQAWVRGPNNGLILRASNSLEFSSMDLITFHSEQAGNPSQRPRLKILYSVKK